MILLPISGLVMVYLPEVSIGLFEVGQLFILQEFVDKDSNTKKFGFPFGLEVNTGETGFTGATDGFCDWIAEWQTSDPKDIFMFQFDMDFNTGTQTALLTEEDGPPLEKVTSLSIPLGGDSAATVDSDGYLVTDKIKSEALQINVAIRSEKENTFKRTLLIKDKCTDVVIAEIVFWGETVGEDERLKVMTQKYGV